MTGADFLEMLAKQKVPTRLFSQAYGGKYLFVSNDEKEGDNVIEAHGSPDDIRDLFFLHPGGNGLYQLQCSTGKWVFVSNDEDDGDQIVEAHVPSDDKRSQFRFNLAGDQGTLSSDEYGGVFLFVSRTTIEGDNVIEAHRDNSDSRNVFSLVVPDSERYTLHDANYSISGLPVPEEEPCPPEYTIDLVNDSNQKTIITRRISIKHTTEKTWSGTELGIKPGVETTFKVGIPMIVDGKYKISPPMTLHGRWGETITEQETFEQEIASELQPHTHVVVHCQLYKRMLVVPYTGTLTIQYRSAAGTGAYEEDVSGKYMGDEYNPRVWVGDPKPIEVEPATLA